MKKFSATILTFWLIICSQAQTNISKQVEQLLPFGKCNVDLMEVSYPARFQELTLKFQTAVFTNKDWWLNYLKQNAKSQGPLPYNPKFGLTSEEYTEYLSLGEKRTLEKVQSCVIQVSTNYSAYEFDGGHDLPELTGLKVDLKTLAVVTPFGILKNPQPDEYPGGAALGAYSGYRWNFEQSDIDHGDITTASLLIGNLKASGRNFIYYKGSVVRTNTPVSKISLVIYYDKK